jgi:hypothetical protein
MDLVCCDGTGFTGEFGVICPDHYEDCGDLLEMLHYDPLEYGEYW